MNYIRILIWISFDTLNGNVRLKFPEKEQGYIISFSHEL